MGLRSFMKFGTTPSAQPDSPAPRIVRLPGLDILIVRCSPAMKRIFSHPLSALIIGLALRLFFVFRVPSSAGDTALYESLASNWLKFRIYGMPVNGVLTPLDIRMPGYPAYLALLQAITRRSAADSRLWVMLGQVLL